MTIGEMIAAARLKRSLSREALAEKLAVTVQTVDGWENGRSRPDRELLKELAGLLGITTESLLADGIAPDFAFLNPYQDPGVMCEYVDKKARAAGLIQTQEALSYMMWRHSQSGYLLDSSNRFRIPCAAHPLTMACHALAMGLTDDDVLAACLLHGIADDTGITVEDLPDEIDELVRETVSLVSCNTLWKEKDAEPLDGYGRIRIAYYRNIREHPLAALVKCLDSCVSLATMADRFDKARMVNYVRETELYVMPLLGVVEHVLDWKDAAWMLTFQMKTLMETIKRLL